MSVLKRNLLHLVLFYFCFTFVLVYIKYLYILYEYMFARQFAMHLISGLSTYVKDRSVQHITVTTPPDSVYRYIPRVKNMSHLISLPSGKLS